MDLERRGSVACVSAGYEFAEDGLFSVLSHVLKKESKRFRISYFQGF